MLYYRPDWTNRVEARKLREFGGLRVDLFDNEHQALHRRISMVPLLGIHALQKVAFDHQPTDNLYENIDSFLLLTEKAIHHPKADSIERRLGELTMEAVLMQRDFIQDVRGRGNVPVSRRQMKATYDTL